MSAPERLRVAYLSPESALYGSEVSLLEAAGRLDPRAFSPRLVTLLEGPLEEAARARGLPVDRLPWLADLRRRPWGIPWAALRLALWLRRRRVHILEINRINYPLLLAAWPAARLSGARLVHRERMHAKRRLSALRRFLISRHDRVIAVTRGAVAPWAESRGRRWGRFLERQVVVVPSGRDVEALSRLPKRRSLVRALGVPDEAPLVGLVGALDPRKRPELFLRAARRVLDRRPDCRFLIVGDAYAGASGAPSGYAASLRLLARELGLEGHVVFAGYREDAFRLIQNLDVLALTSEREALGGVLIEALAAGVPAVASAVDGIPEVVDDGVTGYLVRTSRPEDYAEPILRLLDDPALRERLGAASGERARLFDQRALGTRLEAVYRGLAPNSPKPSLLRSAR